MGLDNLLSVSDIVEELNTGKAVVKFILKRFSRFMTPLKTGGQLYYPPEVLKLVAFACEKIDMGLLPSQIEKELEKVSVSNNASIADLTENEDIRLSKNGLQLLTELFNDIGEQQKRIAVAHEKRAAAEERKAVAIEKRADAEEKKAAAMNNIATALQEMNRLRPPADLPAEQIAHQAAAVISSSEEPMADDPDLSVLIEEDLPENEDPMVDDLLEETLEELDDLSDLLDDGQEVNMELDDLSKLIDPQEADNADITQELDDLSLLIDSVSQEAEPEDLELDDLSALLDNDQEQDMELDDLSKLIDDEEPDSVNLSVEMDDLSLLIDPPEEAPVDVEPDDLSKLIEDDTTDAQKPEDKIPAVNIDASPENVDAYKAEIMKLIIGFKKDGMTVEQTTDVLNHNKIQTLSGKSEWSLKAITQIYKFIESVA